MHRLSRNHTVRQAGVVHGHFAPAKEDLAFLFHNPRHGFHHPFAAFWVFGQKHMRHGIGARLRQANAVFLGFLAEKAIRDLQHHACAITHIRISASGAAVGEVFQNVQTIRNNGMRRFVMNVADKAHAAGIMLMGRIIKPLFLSRAQGKASLRFNPDILFHELLPKHSLTELLLSFLHGNGVSKGRRAH